MSSPYHIDVPLVSVIIPCYNHGSYLQRAVESVRQQDYTRIEIVIVDDGSTDNTREVAQSCGEVVYVSQSNQGLSAARNAGIQNSSGEFLVFLDADDWMLEGAVFYNAKHLIADETLAFVSGGHDKVFVKENVVKEDITIVNADHYLNFLRGNYIGMHAAVMYSRWIFDEVLFDTSLKMCEDYDIYFKIARKHPVAHHTKKIAAYRIHSSNMSNNIPLMLSAVLRVLHRQEKLLSSSAEKSAYRQGKEIWKNYYCRELYHKIILRKARPTLTNIFTLLQHKPSFFIRLLKRFFTYAKKNNKEVTVPLRF